MNWLLWKDYRVNRQVLFVGLLFVLVPHTVGLYATCREAIRGRLVEGQWERNLTGSSAFSFVFSQLTIALLGGNLIAGERVDRSAEFQASLPLSRKRILAGKLLLALIVTAVIWLNVLIGYGLLWRLGLLAGEHRGQEIGIFLNVVITGMVFFCVAWFFSSLTASPALAVCGGLFTPVLIVGGIYFIGYLFGVVAEVDKIAEPCYRTICLILAPLCFIIGTWYYLRRVEP
jgi:ABC-type transport system involved in multi-copper enzyme maturation permease subunit